MRDLLRVCLGVVLLGTCVASHAEGPMPEFGSSVSFEKSVPDISMGGLRGKNVVIVFFQSKEMI
jgi:hypothetical protein